MTSSGYSVPRVAVIANMIDPHRARIFHDVQARGDVELLVVYETAEEPNRDWGPLMSQGFSHEVLRSLTIDLHRLGADAYLHISPRPLAPLKAFEPDVVIGFGGGIWSSPANIAALAARRRQGWAFVPWWGSFPRARPTLVRRVMEPWVRRFVRAGDAWVAYGSRAERELTRLGADPSGIVIVPNVARTATIRRGGDSSRPRGLRFLFVGRLIEEKGVRELLEARSAFPDGELWIAGDGPLRGVVEQAASRDPKIRMLGHLGWDELQVVYLSVDALVLPSYGDVWGLVVNEALERGLAVISTDQVGAVDDLITDGRNGYVVPAGSSTALCDAMHHLSSWSPSQWALARSLSQTTMKKWSRERAAEALVEAATLGIDRRRDRSRSRFQRTLK